MFNFPRVVSLNAKLELQKTESRCRINTHLFFSLNAIQI